MNTLTTFAAFLAVIAGAPPPAIAPSPAATAGVDAAGLREIGRVRATSPLCRALVADAVGAIDLETANDGRLTGVEATLRDVDLDSSVVAKERGKRDITRQYVALRAAAVAGGALMKHFREAAKTATDPAQRDDLKSFGDALDGALHHQRAIADALGRFVAYLDTHDPIDKDAHDRMVFDAVARASDLRFPHTAFDVRDFGPTAGVPDPLSVTAKNASAEIVTRAAPIATDEDAAAAAIDPAFKAC